MHVSVFIERGDEIGARSLVHEDTQSFSVTVRVGAGELAIFADDAGQLLEFGRAIVRECETFAASAPQKIVVAPFTGDPIEPEIREVNGETVVDMTGVIPQHVPYAFNDGVQHVLDAVVLREPEDDHPF
jgi:hypothetical protein